MREKVPNERLAALIREAGITNRRLAKRMCDDSAAGKGEAVFPTHTNVEKWLSGATRRPKARTLEVLLQVLSSLLGREVTSEEAGFQPPTGQRVEVAEQAAHYPEQAGKSVSVLDALAEADHQGHELGPEWDEQSTPAVITSYLFTQPLTAVEVPAGDKFSLAAPIRAMTASFMQLDFQYGGGYMRSLLRSFFRETVVPRLHENHPEAERRELFSAAAEVVQLLGWTSYDAGRHAAGRMYLIQGLRLAREAGDHMLGGRLLSNLSHQANYLGRFADAVQYARAATAAVAGVATPTVSALLMAMEARALASQGDAAECAKVMDRVETLIDQSRPTAEPAWVSYVDEAEIAGEWAHCFRDLGQPNKAQAFAEQAVQQVPPRTQAFMRMVEAAAAIQDGSLDEALSMANRAVDLAGPLDSARYHRYLTDFHADVTTHFGSDHRVRDFSAMLQRSYPTLKLPPRVND